MSHACHVLTGCVNHTTVFSGLKARLYQQSISCTDPINSCRLWRQADLLLNLDFAELLCNLGSVSQLPSSHFLIYKNGKQVLTNLSKNYGLAYLAIILIWRKRHESMGLGY